MSYTDRDYALVIEGALVYGFRGTKCVSHALQVMGIDVCGIIPESLLVHFHYKYWAPAVTRFTVEYLRNMYATLKSNGLHKKFTHIITGYTETPEMLQGFSEIVKDMRACNPYLIYLWDPVIGDNGAIYESMESSLASCFYNSLIPLADITTPNQFEVESLSGMKVNSPEEALVALQKIHDIGPNIVIMTSSKINGEGVLTTIGSQWKDGTREAYMIDYPCLDAYLLGTGDLFAGSFTVLLRKCGNFKEALEKALSICQHVCQRTYREARDIAGPGNELTWDLLELRISQSTPFIMNPSVLYPSTNLL